MRLLLALSLFVSVSASAITLEEYRSGAIITPIPSGNRYASMPVMTVAGQPRAVNLAEVNGKFERALLALESDRIGTMVKQVAPLYGVDPLLVIGAIIGEHSFNTQLVMNGQNAYIGMLPGWVSRFRSNRVSLADTIQRPEFARCRAMGNDYDRWYCNIEVWEQSFRGRQGYSGESMRSAFFNPVYQGHTFGVGQLDPLRALMVADRVARVTGRPPIDVSDSTTVYGAILDTRQSVHYLSANVALILEAYRNYAKMDISTNMGIVATLYNLGNERRRAWDLMNQNIQRLSRGETTLRFPEENHYGWFVNSKEQRLREWLARF